MLKFFSYLVIYLKNLLFQLKNLLLVYGLSRILFRFFVGRREVAKTMMEKDTHMAILEIIKEYGISLREGSQGRMVLLVQAQQMYMVVLMMIIKNIIP